MRATVTAHRDYRIATIDDRIYGAFLEHLGRAIYSGIYEPGHPTADANGMRGDVVDLVKALQIPVVRYPGGNFVSAYNWEDGVGPRDQRPTRLDLAWHTSESNAVGVHEFADWCASVGSEMMLAINLGSRGLDEARNFVEYVNGPTGSHWGDLRKKNGRAEPFGVKHWCLGNEMDGPWQVGHKTAHEYGRLANETAKTLRAFDPSLQLVVCGSSHSDMATYPEWERVVLEHCYDSVDYVSLHMYFNNREKNTAEFLALNAKLDAYIATIASTIEFVRAQKRSKKRVAISFDEWNVWYHSMAQDKEILSGAKGWPHAPPLLEDVYNFEDVLQVGCILNTFIRRSDVVRDRLHRPAGQRHRADHDRAERDGVAADDLLSLLLRIAVRPRRGAPAQRQLARLRRQGRRQRALRRHRRRPRRGRRRADLLRRQSPCERDDRPRRQPQRLRRGQARRLPGDDRRQPRSDEHRQGADDGRAEEGRERVGRRRAPDREARALLLPDDPAEPRLGRIAMASKAIAIEAAQSILDPPRRFHGWLLRRAEFSPN